MKSILGKFVFKDRCFNRQTTFIICLIVPIMSHQLVIIIRYVTWLTDWRVLFSTQHNSKFYSKQFFNRKQLIFNNLACLHRFSFLLVFVRQAIQLGHELGLVICRHIEVLKTAANSIYPFISNVYFWDHNNCFKSMHFK